MGGGDAADVLDSLGVYSQGVLQGSFRTPFSLARMPMTTCHVWKQGMGGGDATEVIGAKEPRKSWQMRKRQERAALKEGLAEWQVGGPLLGPLPGVH